MLRKPTACETHTYIIKYYLLNFITYPYVLLQKLSP